MIVGQERTQKMNRMYYQGAHACVIMFDLTYEKSLDISLKWKEDLDSKCTLENGDPIPCILLANKVNCVCQSLYTKKYVTLQFNKMFNYNYIISIACVELWHLVANTVVLITRCHNSTQTL